MATGARTITVVRAPKVDKLSTAPVAAASEKPITGCIVLPRQTYEQGRGWITVDGYDVYILDSSLINDGGTLRRWQDGDIVSTDRIRVDDGTTWSVDGTPARYEKGTAMKAVLVKLKRVG